MYYIMINIYYVLLYVYLIQIIVEIMLYNEEYSSYIILFILD